MFLKIFYKPYSSTISCLSCSYMLCLIWSIGLIDQDARSEISQHSQRLSKANLRISALYTGIQLSISSSRYSKTWSSDRCFHSLFCHSLNSKRTSFVSLYRVFIVLEKKLKDHLIPINVWSCHRAEGYFFWSCHECAAARTKLLTARTDG